jgi:hypothetical protein
MYLRLTIFGLKEEWRNKAVFVEIDDKRACT